MILDVLRILLRFLVLVSIQVLVLNNVELGGYINPLLYVLFLLTLPVKTPRVLLLVIAMVTGLTIDMFQNTMGMHAAASLVLAYMRPGWLKIIAPRDGYDTEAIPSIRQFGYRWFLAYSAVLVFVHHFTLFFIEVFRMSEFGNTMLRILLSTIVTLLLIMLSQFMTLRPERSGKQ